MESVDVENMRDTQTKLLDFPYLKELSGGDVEFCKEILKLFVANVSKDIRDLQHFFSNQLWDELKFRVHFMRSTMSSMKLTAVGQALSKFEHAVTEGKTQQADELFPKVIILCRQAVSEAEDLLVNEKKK